jgi:hypothetical protein
MLESPSKELVLGSRERIQAFDRIDTSTLPRAQRIREKKGIVSEVISRHLLPDELLRTHSAVYLGSGTDIEYPLALGCRNIVMIDPILETSGAVDEIVSRIRSILLTEASLIRNQQNMTFDCDFGGGPEVVTVQLDGRRFEPSATAGDIAAVGPIKRVGLILCFAAQGPHGEVEVPKELVSRVVDGGFMLVNHQLHHLSSTTNEPEIIELGKAGL